MTELDRFLAARDFLLTHPPKDLDADCAASIPVLRTCEPHLAVLFSRASDLLAYRRGACRL